MRVLSTEGKGRGWITLSWICRILDILRKPNSIIPLLFIQNISLFLREFCHFFVFPSTKSNTMLSPGFLRQRLNNLQRSALLTSFWCHWFNNLQRAALLKSLVQYDKDSFQFWSTAADYGEWCMWFYPIRSGEIFWMTNNQSYYNMA